MRGRAVAAALVVGGAVLAGAAPALAEATATPTATPSAQPTVQPTQAQPPGGTIPTILPSPGTPSPTTAAPTPTAAPTTAAPESTTAPPAPVVRRTTSRPDPAAVVTSEPPPAPLPEVSTRSGLTFDVPSSRPTALAASPASAASPTRHLERVLQTLLAGALLLGAAGATGLYLTREGS